MDKNTSADILKYTQIATPAQGTNFGSSERAEYDEGYSKRQKMLRASATAAPVNVVKSVLILHWKEMMMLF